MTSGTVSLIYDSGYWSGIRSGRTTLEFARQVKRGEFGDGEFAGFPMVKTWLVLAR